MGKYDLASIIKSRRKNIGLTHRQLADKLDVTVTTISRWENGVNEPDSSKFIKICKVLALEVNDFLESEEE